MSPERSLQDLAASWRPSPIETQCRLDLAPVTRLMALFDDDSGLGEGDGLPLGWHWLHYTPTAAQESLGEDGHPAAGAFLPPFDNRRRMMAGGRLKAHRPLRIGESYVRRSQLTDARFKQGRSGEMLFTTVRHLFTVGDSVVLEESEDVVYRRQAAGSARGIASSSRDVPTTSAPPSPDAALPSVPSRSDGAPAVKFRCDATALFRFSALTFNAHRIHYDLPYATDVEAYPGLVVHGPLLALLMLEPARRAGLATIGFEYRLRAPLFDGVVVTATSNRVGRGHVATAYGAGTVAATASLELAPSAVGDW